MPWTEDFRDCAAVDWDRPLFSLGRQSYSRSDVIIAAMLGGDWSRLEDQVRKGLACVKRTRHASPPPIDLQKATVDFRYARNLLTVEETEEWLERSGVTFEDWTSYLERSLLRRVWANELERIVVRSVVSDDELRACVYAEAVCSGELGRFAQALAARVAVSERAAASGGDANELPDAGSMVDERIGVACARLFRQCDRAGDRAQEDAARIAYIAHLEATFQTYVRNGINPAAVQSQIEIHRIDWVRVQWRYIVLTEPQAAREAALCVGRDGEPLEDVARRARAVVLADDRLLERIDPPLRDAVLSAKPKDVVGPVAVGDRFHLGIIDSKCMPSVEDPEIRRRAEDALVATLVAGQMKHVRWHEELGETTGPAWS